jgi:hypothetical protein
VYPPIVKQDEEQETHYQLLSSCDYEKQTLLIAEIGKNQVGALPCDPFLF